VEGIMTPLNFAMLLLLMQTTAPIFESDPPPGEGPHEFVAAANALRLFDLPAAVGTARTIRVSLNQPLPYDASRHKTIQAGRVRVLKATQWEIRDFGSVPRVFHDDYYSDKFKRQQIELQAGTIIEYLQYRAEGSCFFRIGGKVMDGTCPLYDETKFHLEREEKTEWWIHVSVGTSKGWLLVDKSLKEMKP
jgi:hypothetical protein